MKTYKSNVKAFGLKANKTEFKKIKITRSSDADYFARHFYYDDLLIYESVFIILMNSNNNTIGYAKISQGGINSCLVDVRLIAKYAVESLAVGVILVHNHPSGKLTPSKSDIELTNKVKDALNLFDCKLLDHLILTENEYLSMADESIVNFY